MDVPDNAVHINSVDWEQPVIMFRCLKCHNQISPNIAKKDEAGYARCPICDSYLRQMFADGDLYDTYV